MTLVSIKSLPRLAAALALAYVPACTTLSPEPTGTGQQVVTAYTQAFNARDIDAMGAMMHPDIEWWSVTDDGAELVSIGRDTLASDMEGYFEDPNAVTSQLSGWAFASPYVSTTETVHWTDENGDEQSQAALVVYEVSGDSRVRRVWYYPAVDAE